MSHNVDLDLPRAMPQLPFDEANVSPVVGQGTAHLEQISDHSVVTVSPETPLTEAIALLAQPDDGRVPSAVVVVSDQFVGVLTQRKALQLALENIRELTVADAIEQPLTITAAEAQDFGAILHLFEQHHLEQLPILGEDNEVLGLVTLASLNRALSAERAQMQSGSWHQQPAEVEQPRSLEQQVQERTAELCRQTECEKLLATIAQKISSSLHLEEVLTTAVKQVRQFLQVERVLVYQLFESSGTVIAESIEPGWTATYGESTLCYHPETYLQPSTRAVANVQEAELPQGYLQLLEQFEVKAQLMMPVHIDGRLWGVLIAHQCSTPRHWQTSELDVLDRLAVHIAIAIQKATVYRQCQRELTERQRAEAALRTSEQLYASLVSAVPVGIFRTDPQGNCLYVNESWCRMAGLTPAEARGAAWAEALHPEDRERVFAEWYQAAQAKEPFCSEYRFQRPDGVVHWVLGQAVEERVEGKCVGYIGTLTDITVRKQAEQQNHFQAQLLNAVEQAVISTDREGYITYWNRFAETLYGWKAAEVLGRSILEVTPAPASREAAAGILSRLQAGESWSGEFTVQRRDQTSFLAAIIDSPIYDEQGNLLGMIGVSTDVSDRHQTEQQLKESEARFQEIAGTISQFFFVRSAVTGQFVYVSPAYETIWRRSCESLYHNPDSWLEAIHPEERQSVLTSLTEQMAGNSVTREYRIIQPDGNLRWICAQINPVRDEGGNVVRFIGFAEDITERKQAEEALRRNQLRLQQLSTSVPAMLYSVVQQAEGTLQFEYLSSEVKTIYEIEPERALQDATLVYQQILPAEREVFFERVWQTTQTLEPFHYEWQIITPSGQRKWVQAAAQTERRSDGAIAWHGVMLDVSDRKRSEAALKQSEATLRSFFNSSSMMMGVVELLDHDIRHIADNATTAAFFGLTPPQMQNRLASELGVPPQYIEQWLHHYRTSRQTGEPVRFEYAHRVESECWLAATVSPIANTQHRFAYIVEDISQRKQVEIELQQAYQNLQFHLENTPLAVIKWDREFRVQHWSTQAQEIFGWQPEEVLGKHWSEWRFISEADLEVVTLSAQRLLNGYDPRNFICNRNYTRSGAIVYCEWYSSALCDEAGNVVSILSLVQNATARHQAESRLRDREQFLRSIYNGVEQSIFVVDITPARDFRYVDWNPVAARAIGKSAVEIADKTFEEVLEPTMAALARDRFTSCLRSGNPLVQEDYLSVAGGTWWLHTLTPLRDEQGEIYRIIGTANNITERKQIEQERDRLLQRVEQHNQILESCVRERTTELEETNAQMEEEIHERQQVERALRESEEKYRLIFNQAAIGIAQIALDGRYLQVNQKLTEILGYSSEELYRDVTLFDITHPDDLDISLEYVRRLIADEVETYTLEKRYIRKNGLSVWVQICISLLRDRSGNPLYFVKVIEDIGDRKQAEQALSLSERKFRGAFDTIAVGMAIIAITGGFIEVNTALCQMLGYSETELLQLSLHEITISELSTDFHLFEQMMAGEISVYRSEKRYRCKNGREVWGWLSLSLIRSTDQPLFLIAQIQDITERKQTEEQLRASEARLAEAQRIAHIGNWEFDVLTGAVIWSTNLFNIFERDPEQGEPSYPQLVQLIHPDDRAPFQQAVEIARSTAQSYVLDLQILRPNSVGYVEARGEAILNAQGQVVSLFGTAMDITPRKQAEQALRESEERFRQLAENINAVFYVRSLESDRHPQFYVSPAYEKIWGRSCARDCQQTETWLETVHPSDREQIRASVDRKLLGEPFKEEYRIVRPDGSVRWIADRTSPIQDSTGRVYRQVGIAEDITERKHSEDLLRQKHERERLTMAIAQHIRNSLDLDDILSTTVQEVLHLLQADRVSVFRVTPDGYGRVIAEAIVPGQPSILGMEFPDETFPEEYYDLYSDGHARIVPNVATDAIAHCIAEFLVELGVRSKLSVPIIQGETLWGVMTVHHCSAAERHWQKWELELIEGLALQLAIAIQQSELYQQLQSELVQKERSLREKSVLLKEVHHRVKNNLQVISSLLWLQSQQSHDEQALRLFKDAQNRVQTIALIHEQLYRSKNLAQVDFSKYLQLLVGRLFRSYGVEHQAIALEIDVNAEPLTLEAAIPCGLIVNELISNSLKYAFPDNRAGELCICLRSNAREYILSVRDNGIGLPQIPPIKSLGLLVVDDLVEQLNGRIELDCQQGTAFTIVFPDPVRQGSAARDSSNHSDCGR